MKSFDLALEDCLERICRGEELESCLRQYPRYAVELRPLLRAALEVKQGSNVRPTEVFVERARVGLVAYMRSHPHGRSNLRHIPVTGSATNPLKTPRRLKPVGQFLGAFSVLLFAFFATGTALAQSALPGQSLYSWKRTSETVWQAVSPNPVDTNLALAQRRTQEALAVSGPPRTEALQGYEQVLNQLASQGQQDQTVQQQIIVVLTVQHADLAKSGIELPKLNQYLANPGTASVENPPTVTPEATATLQKHKKHSTGGKTDEDTRTPTPTATPTPSATPSLTPSPTFTPTPAASFTPIFTPASTIPLSPGSPTPVEVILQTSPTPPEDTVISTPRK